jgi:hypothetical protein
MGLESKQYKLYNLHDAPRSNFNWQSIFWSWLNFQVPCRVDTPEDCASLIGKRNILIHIYGLTAPMWFLLIFILLAEANIKLKLESGILIGVPIPQEHSATGHIIESAINQALNEARWTFALLLSFYRLWHFIH